MIFIDIKTTYQFDQEQIDPKKLEGYIGPKARGVGRFKK